MKITGNTDAEKLANLKAKFQTIFRKTDTQGRNIVFEKIWSNTNGLKENLFVRPPLSSQEEWKALAQQDFTDYVNTYDNKIFTFLKIK